MGKSEGLRKCKAKIKTFSQFEDLKKAVINYAKYCEGQDPQFIKYFSSFMTDWEDFIDFEGEDNNKFEVNIGRILELKR